MNGLRNLIARLFPDRLITVYGYGYLGLQKNEKTINHIGNYGWLGTVPLWLEADILTDVYVPAEA